MKTNLGSYDVAIRFSTGCVLLFVGVHFETWWGLIGLLPLLTAIVGYCPLYAPFRVDTSDVDDPPGPNAPK